MARHARTPLRTRAPLRVAFIITGLELGGSETQLTRLAMGLHERKEEVLVISLTPGGHFAPILRKAGVRVIHGSSKNPFALVSFVRTQLKQFKPNIAHSFLWHANQVTRLAAQGLGIVKISSYRGKEPNTARVVLDTLTRPLGDWTTTNSAYLAQFYHFSRKTTSVIQNGVPADVWKGTKPQPKSRTALAIGRLVWEKDYLTLIDAAALAPEWTFSIVGPGPREQELREYAAQKCVTNVHFLGQRSDVPKLLERSQCLVHLAFTEGSPNAVIEAMLVGVPVIGSDIPAVRELVYGHGMLVPERDPRAVVAALKKLPPPARVRSITTWARERFAMDTMVENYRSLYHSLV